MIADQDRSARQSHIGDLGPLPLLESLKACFAFFNIKPFLVYTGPLEFIQTVFTSMLVL